MGEVAYPVGLQKYIDTVKQLKLKADNEGASQFYQWAMMNAMVRPEEQAVQKFFFERYGTSQTVLEACQWFIEDVNKGVF